MQLYIHATERQLSGGAPYRRGVSTETSKAKLSCRGAAAAVRAKTGISLSLCVHERSVRFSRLSLSVYGFYFHETVQQGIIRRLLRVFALDTSYRYIYI